MDGYVLRYKYSYFVLFSAGLCFGSDGPVRLKHSESLFLFFLLLLLRPSRDALFLFWVRREQMQLRWGGMSDEQVGIIIPALKVIGKSSPAGTFYTL